MLSRWHASGRMLQDSWRRCGCCWGRTPPPMWLWRARHRYMRRSSLLHSRGALSLLPPPCSCCCRPAQMPHRGVRPLQHMEATLVH